ncbi:MULTISPECIES: hypothetical protein [unclassified Flavobacterium]|uniref:hypothetical protein n=1 Tax=unclassified Flavobacterium TaxID=196869 RepID=UPI003609795E
MKTKRHYRIFFLLLLAHLTVFAQLPSVREKKTMIPYKDNSKTVLIKIKKADYDKAYEASKKKAEGPTEQNLFDANQRQQLDVFKNKAPLADTSDLYLFTGKEKDNPFVSELKNNGGNEINYLKSNILYNYYKRKKNEVEQQIQSKFKESKKEDNQDNLAVLTSLTKSIDSLYIEQQKYVDSLSTFKSQDFRWIFPSWYNSKPTKKEAFFETLYGKSPDNDFYFVNNAALQLNSAGSTIQSEITAAYLKPLRVSLGTLVSNSGTEASDEPDNEKEADDTEAFQRLLSGGGNIYMNIELPFLYYGNDFFKVYSTLYAKGAMEITEFSNDVDTSTGNGSLGGSLYLSVATDKKEFVFYTSANWGLYAGSDAFLDRLQVQKNYFGFGQVTVGVTVLDRLRLSMMTNTFGVHELQSGRVVFGVQVLSGLFE